MVALLSSDPTRSYLDTLAPPAGPRPRARHLRALPSPRAGVRPAAATGEGLDGSSAMLWVAAALVVALLAFTALRVVQEAPPAASWADVQQGVVASSPGPPAAEEWVRTVKPGETLWGIAGELAPDADRREVVQRLAERNGGSRLLAGQTLIVPAGIGQPEIGNP